MPESSTVILLGIGILGLVSKRQQHRQASKMVAEQEKSCSNQTHSKQGSESNGERCVRQSGFGEINIR